MAKHDDYLPEGAMKTIIAVLGDAYYDNGGEFYRPDKGNTPLSFAIAAWQSSLYNAEQAFPEIPGQQRCIRIGSVFYIDFFKCHVHLYKFRPMEKAETFRLVATSRTRERIIENNQQSLFAYTLDQTAQPNPVQELVIIHTGTPEDGLSEVHIGAPISSQRAEDGWLWLEETFNQAVSGAYEKSAQLMTVQPFTTMNEPEVRLDPKSEDMEDMEERPGS